jgi:hypothetical protein
MTARVAPTFSPVTDAETAIAFLSALLDAGMLYHPDDSAADCLGDRGIAPEALDLIQTAMQAAHDHLADPSETALHLIDDRDAGRRVPSAGR